VLFGGWQAACRLDCYKIQQASVSVHAFNQTSYHLHNFGQTHLSSRLHAYQLYQDKLKCKNEVTRAIRARRTGSMHPKNQTCSSRNRAEAVPKEEQEQASGNNAATVAAQARGAAGRSNPQQENSTQEQEQYTCLKLLACTSRCAIRRPVGGLPCLGSKCR
jgi:hypothetical protein